MKNRLEIIKERYELPIFETIIYDREDLAKSLEQIEIIGVMDIPDPRSVFDYKPDSKAANEFNLLAEEVLTKIRNI